MPITDSRLNRLAITNNGGNIVERYRYNPFGEPFAFDTNGNSKNLSTVTIEPWFGGMRYINDVGLYLGRHRVMHPKHGMWLGLDPKGYIDSPNLYAYTAQSPIDFVDPLGLALAKFLEDPSPQIQTVTAPSKHFESIQPPPSAPKIDSDGKSPAKSKSKVNRSKTHKKSLRINNSTRAQTNASNAISTQSPILNDLLSMMGFYPPDILNKSSIISAQVVHEATGDPINNIEATLPFILQELSEQNLLEENILIGVLATVGVETEFISQNEDGGNEYFIRRYWTNKRIRKELGNKYESDAINYRGRGIIQLTGRWNYEHFGKVLDLPLLENPDLALNPEIAAKILVQYFKERGVVDASRSENWRKVRTRVNKAGLGMKDFLRSISILKKYFDEKK